MMIHRENKLQTVFKKVIHVITASAVILGCFATPLQTYAAEQSERVFTGINNAQVILNNLDYYDVGSSGTWAAEAIYESGALDVMKGYGNKQFGRTDVVTKEQAIAIAYRAAGREADALKAAEELDNARNRDGKNTNVLNMQFDGYLKLAADDGLITAQDLSDAFKTDQTQLVAGSFFRSSPAQRQEMAYWLAKALKLELSYKDQAIFNSYNDWKLSDPIKVPYIEEVLQNKIMNGNGNGYFNPEQSLTREQAAQIIKNSSKYLLQAMGYEKLTGTIENMSLTRKVLDGKGLETAVLDVRNINGRLHKINIGYIDDPAQSDRNEQTGQFLEPTILDTVVYKNGIISNSSTLASSDRIEYIVTPLNTVKYIKVYSSEVDTKYLMAQIKDVKFDTLTMGIAEFFTLATPDIASVQKYVSFDPGVNKPVDSYILSNNATVISDGNASDVKSLKPDSFVILTITNDIITKVETFDVSMLKGKELGIVNGIVEENNPELGYITLYSEKGTGTLPGAAQAGLLRTYYYSADEIQIYKNHNKTTISDVSEGDSAFLKLDDNSAVIAVSAVSNFIVKYGKIISTTPISIAVEYEDGTQQVLDKDKNAIVILDGKISDLSALKDGDSVSLVLQITNSMTSLKRINISGRENLISNIYKGTFSYIDVVSDSIVLQNMEIMDKDRWIRSDQKGFNAIKLADKARLYSDGKLVDEETANGILKDRQVYIAVEKDYGGEEKTILIAFQNPRDAEAPIIYNDSISGIGTASGQFTLYRENKKIRYTDGTIIIKDGRLVSGNSIKSKDNAYVAASMDFASSDLYAGIINIGEKFAESSLKVYRGRISQINTNKDFKVVSFSLLNGLKWDYWNTPKTFNITYNTRILDDNGVVSQRDFIPYGQGSYLDKTVYIVAKDGEAILVSTAPFGNPYNVKGEVYEITNGAEIKILNAKIYDPYNFIWKDSSEISLSILKNSVIIKASKIISFSELKMGDRIRVVKRDSTTSGEAYIVFVEE